MTTSLIRKNKFGAKCSYCMTYIPEGEGALVKGPKGWDVFHIVDGHRVTSGAECPKPAPTLLPTHHAAAKISTSNPTEPTAPDGVHKLGEDFYRVSRRKGWSGKVFVNVQKLRLRSDGTGSFQKTSYAMAFKLSEATLLTYAQAQAFGREHSFCVVCATHLEDALSIYRGIGPVCEKRPQFAGQFAKRTVDAQREAVEALRKAGTHHEHSTGKFTLKKTGEAIKPLGLED